MKQPSKKIWIGLAIGILATLPLLWLECSFHETKSRGNLKISRSSTSYGWPLLCIHLSELENRETAVTINTTTVDTWKLICNIVLLSFVGLAYGVFAAGITKQLRLSITEFLAIIVVAAIVFSAWSNDMIWDIPEETRFWRPNTTPAWAKYLVYFSFGCAIAAILQWRSGRTVTAVDQAVTSEGME